MKKLLCLLLVAGCSNVEYSHKNVSTIPQLMDAFYFSGVFLDAPEVDVQQQIQKLSNNYTWKSETNVFENSFTCSYSHKSGGESNGGKINCEYLGNCRGQDMVARYYWTGGSGSFQILCFVPWLTENCGRTKRYSTVTKRWTVCCDTRCSTEKEKFTFI
jgi:hypothetical protein